MVVVDGVAIETTGLPVLSFVCEPDNDPAPTIPELFDLARQIAGARSFEFRSDLARGTVMAFVASDRSVETQVEVRRWTTSTAPTIVGWEAVLAAAESGVSAWEAYSGDRTTTIRITGGERALRAITTIESDGEVLEIREQGSAIDPSTLQQPWEPYTVDGVFELIGALAGRGEVAAVFDRGADRPLLRPGTQCHRR